MPNDQGQTLWEMLTRRDEQITRAATAPVETKPHICNPLGLNLDDVVRVTTGADTHRFQVVEVDEFDRGSMGKIADYRLFKKADPAIEGSEAVDRYLRVFPSVTPDGKTGADLLLLTWLFDCDYDKGVMDQLDRNEFPIEGDEYAGFVRNQGVTLPYDVKVTEIKTGALNKRRMRYWDFSRPKGNSYEAFFVEMDLDTKRFDAYIAEPLSADAVSFLKKQ